MPVPKFTSLTEFNQELLKKCDQDMCREHYLKDAVIADLFEKDKESLLPLPSIPFDTSKYMTVRTNAYAKFSLNEGLHIYSTAPKHANTRVLVKITAHEVVPLDENHREIVRHKRLYGNYKQQSMDWLPYLTQLSRCPGALKYSGIYGMLPDPLKEYLEKCSKRERGQTLQAIAHLCSGSSFEQAIDTIVAALDYGTCDIDSLIAIHQRLTGTVPDLKPVKLPAGIPEVKSNTLNIADYDRVFIQGGKQVC